MSTTKTPKGAGDTATTPRTSNRGVLLDGNGIRRRREKLALSREDFCAKHKFSIKAIKEIENDPLHRVHLRTLQQLALVFNVSPAELTREIPPPVLLTRHEDIVRLNLEIVESANEFIYATGSRSRDKRYLDTLEKKLVEFPKLVHYRVLFDKPFKRVFQDHLRNLLKLRVPTNHIDGPQTLAITIYKNEKKNFPQEAALCLNEKKALIVIPSISGTWAYDTAVLFEDTKVIEGWRRWIETMYMNGEKVETLNAIDTLGLYDD
jgi:transcriptional regulator with XRE-family HTH domain